MSLMSRVKNRLAGEVGFGTVLGLLSLVAWLGVSSLGGAGQAMTNYERVSGNANRVARIMAMVCELRRNVMRFSQEGDKLSLQRIDEAKAELNVLLPEAVAMRKIPSGRESEKRCKVFSANTFACSSRCQAFTKRKKLWCRAWRLWA
jgi:hypothetical protein